MSCLTFLIMDSTKICYKHDRGNMLMVFVIQASSFDYARSWVIDGAENTVPILRRICGEKRFNVPAFILLPWIPMEYGCPVPPESDSRFNHDFRLGEGNDFFWFFGRRGQKLRSASSLKNMRGRHGGRLIKMLRFLAWAERYLGGIWSYCKRVF